MGTLHLIFITTKLKLQDTKRLSQIPFFIHSSFVQYPVTPPLTLCSSFLLPDVRILHMCELCPELEPLSLSSVSAQELPLLRNPAYLTGWQNERKGICVLPLLSRQRALAMDPSHNSGLLSSLLEMQSVNIIFKGA